MNKNTTYLRLRRALLGASLALGASHAVAQTTMTLDGNWGDATRWTSGVPNSIGAVATLNKSAAGGMSVTLADAAGVDASFTVGSLSISGNNQSRTVNNVGGGTGVIVFDVASGNATFTVSGTGSPTSTLNVGVQLNDNLTLNRSSGSRTATFSKAITSGVAGTGVTVSTQGFTFNAANTYTGDTNINGTAILTLGASGSISNSANITIASAAALAANVGYTVASGQTLRGDGSVTTNNVAVNGGTIAGHGTTSGAASIGSLTINNALSASSASTLSFEIGSTVGVYDQLFLGSLNANSFALTFTNPNDLTLAQGDTFNLFRDAAGTAPLSISGTFASLNLATLGSGLAWDTSQLYSSGVLSVIAIPEPSAFAALAGLGVLGLAATRRRRSS